MTKRAGGRAGWQIAGRENFVFALTAMREQKLRSFLTLLGVMAGVATVIMMVSFVVGFNNQVVASFTQFGTYLVQFQKYEPRFGGGPGGPPEEQRRRRDLTLDDALALKRLGTLAGAVSPERYLFGSEASVRAGRREANGPIVVGVAPDYMAANSHFVEDGRFILDADVLHATRVCVLGKDVAEALFTFHDPIGAAVTVNGVPFLVVGLFEHKGGFFGSNDNFLAMPISTFDERFPQIKNGGGLRPGDTIHIATVPRRPEDYDAWKEQGQAILRARRGLRPDQPDDFAIFTSQGQLEQFRQITDGIAAAMLLVAAIALLVGGVGVMNIMLVSVTERTREIGVRKAIGATDGAIAVQFLAEAVTVTGVGGGMGIVIGFALAYGVRAAVNFPVATPFWSVLLGFAVSTVVGIVSGFWPALRAARMDPVVALRYE